MKYLIISFFGFLLFTSCELDEEMFTSDPSARLSFSTDTISFDTIFTTRGSITKRLHVYNQNDNAIRINEISLLSLTSFYTLTVNGREGSFFEDLEILGNDSMLVLVKISIDPTNQDLPFLVKDAISFKSNSNTNDIHLVSYGQDAQFLKNEVIACNVVFTANRPYVFSDTVLVDTLCSLTIEKGAKLFFDNNAILFIKGSLIVEGDSMNRVNFQQSRLDFDNTPGQWKGIYFLEGSVNNKIDYASIRNAEIGLRLGTPDSDTIPDVILSNSIIENMSIAGILAFSSDLLAINTLIDNCADYTVGNFIGGNYTYQHCTFANFSFDFFRDEPSVVFSDNLVLTDNSLLTADLDVRLENTIIWGSLDEQITISSSGEANFSLFTQNNIVRTNDPLFDGAGNQNTDPLFVDPRQYNYQLDTLSPAKDAGVDLGIEKDLIGAPRDPLPDIGAYERIE